MSRKFFLSLFLFVALMLPASIFAQTLLLQESFEKDEVGYVAKYDANTFDDKDTGGTGADYFMVLSNSHIKLSTYANVGHTLYIWPEIMSNINGTYFFAAEDTSDADNGLGATESCYLVIKKLDVSSYEKVQVSVAVASPLNSGGIEGNETPWEGLEIQYAFDSNIAPTGDLNVNQGTYTTIGAFKGESTDTYFYKEDTNLDNIGEGTQLSSAFQDFTYEFDTNGKSEVSIRIEVFIDGTEEIAFDNVRIYGVGGSISAPTVTTDSASSISTTSATLGGNVTANGGAAVSERGVVYSTSDATPTIAEGATQDANESGTGTFSESIGSLSVNTTYYYNSYAINSEGTSYGTAGSFTTLKLSQTITFGSLPTKTYGDADFAPGATASSGLTVSYSSSNTDVATIVSGNIHIVGAGTCTIYADQAGNSTYYAASQESQSLTINKATPSITWADPNDIVYGTALSAAELNATSPVPGTFVYTPALTTVLDAGAGQTLSVEFTPTDAANYNNNTTATTINVTKATPSITWADPSDIVYGTALSATELNATSPVPGTFVYTPALTTVLDAGAGQTLSVEFTPTDAANYNNNTTATTINVTKATPSITWADPNDIVYGTALSATELNATSPVPGTFVYTPALTTVLDAGAGQTLSVEFTPTDAANYNNNTTATTINVTKATPSITWADPSDIVYGTALSATELNATSPVPGTFVYTPALTTVLDAGAGQTLSVEFTPTDAANYNNNTTTATINVTKATPSITWADPNDIVYGTALSATELNATSPIAGTFVYTPALTTVLDAGAGQTLSVEFTPTDAANYNNNTTATTINVTKATPSITWADPSDIVYGTALSATELNATSPVPGTFVYTPALTTVLDAGAGQTLSVEFTPTDAANYNGNSETATINVTKATPTVTEWPIAAITYGQALSAATLSGGTASVAGSFAYDDDSITPDAGTYSAALTFTPTDGSNYNTVAGNIDVAVAKADPIITNSPDASEITYGETLAEAILAGGTASVDGEFAFTTPSTAPNAGPADHDVTFTPTDGDNYNSVADSVSVTVERATLTAMAENKERDFGVDNPTFTVVYTDFVNSETEAVIDVVPTAATTADTSSPANSYDITVSGGEDDNYTFDYVKGTLTINAVAPAITTVTATEITTQTATAGGSIVSDGGTAITEKGVCYGETADPTTSGNCVADESVETTFSVSLTGLTPATTYFYRAFATSSVETVYGENLSLTTEGVISITSAQSFDVDENSSATTSVGTVAVTGDVQGTLTYSITDGNGAGGFGIDGGSGLITVADQSVLDFETDDTFILTISVEDDENSDSETVEITLNNLNDSYPILTDAEYSLSELAENNAVVGTVAAVDADGDLNLITYDIISGNDSGVFTIDTDSGEITVLDNSTLDFETLEQYVLTVEASDTAQTTEAFVTVNITDENGVCLEAEMVGDLPYTNDSSTTERISSLTSYGTDCLADEYPSADFVYSIELVTGDRVEITLDPADDFDGILLLLANCGEDENCLLAANEVGVGENETLNYEAAQDETLFIVVEGADETTGDFTLNVTEWEEEVPDEIVVDEDPVTDDETPVDEDVVDPVDEDSFISVDEDEMMSTDDDALEVDEDNMTVDEDSEISIDDDPVVVDDEIVDSIDDDPADMDKETEDSDDESVDDNEVQDESKPDDAACSCSL